MKISPMQRAALRLTYENEKSTLSTNWNIESPVMHRRIIDRLIFGKLKLDEII